MFEKMMASLFDKKVSVCCDGSNTFEFDVRSFYAKYRIFESDFQRANTFVFVRCSKNGVQQRTMFDEMTFHPSLL